MNNCKKIIMVSPEFYDIEYAINPFMTDAAGNLKAVDKQEAIKQWESLKSAYETLGIEVAVLSGSPQLQDMVFAANQAFVFGGPESPKCILSKMRYPSRQGEVQFFADWFSKENYEIIDLQNRDRIYGFEGHGDALLVSDRGIVLAGSGPRTDPAVYDELAKITDLEIIDLSPQERQFYHLDTCLCVLDADTIAYVDGVFPKVQRDRLKRKFRTIVIPREEAEYRFAGNAHCPDGKNVLLQRGSEKFIERLQTAGFNPVEVETGEFIKAGGSVFCLKMAVY
jgi:N-dimethylarginine dimethylaminohydrolase